MSDPVNHEIDLLKSASATGSGYATMVDALNLIDRLRARAEAAEERCETWKAQAQLDQDEVRALRARAAGAHPHLDRELGEHEYHTEQLVVFLREAATRPKDFGFGEWRSPELRQAADRLKEMWDSYLAVCPHEAESEAFRARAEAVEAERDRLAKRVVGYDRERDFRATPVYEKMVGGSDVCATCECHCITLGEYDEEIAALRARVPTEDEIEALEVAVEELDALETRELAACGYTDAGPWLAALRALVARNTPAAQRQKEDLKP